MTTLKQGDLVKDKYGYTRKVMENCGTVLHISTFDKHDKYHCTTDEKTLKELGYTWDTPAWEPEIGMMYWFIAGSSEATYIYWDNNKYDHARRDFLGIYQTKELAEAALLEIRRKLGK